MRYLLLTLTVLLIPAPAWAAVEKEAIDAAVERGVAALKRLQSAQGTWDYDVAYFGSTPLAGLTLLECGVDSDDKAIVAAAAAVRKVALTTLDTYSLSLCILFLERLDKSEDTPIIEAMIVNLLTGQTASGGYGYKCLQAFTAQELEALLGESSGRVLRGGRDLSKLPNKGKRAVADLNPVIQDKLKVMARLPGTGGGGDDIGPGGDNSNTQFANLALWVGRRYGVPTTGALLKIDARYRQQQARDGGWSYIPHGVVGIAPGVAGPGSSSAAMTCAGLLGLACGHGVKAGLKREKAKDETVTVDITNDAQLKAGLQALSSAVGTPVGWNGKGRAPEAVARASGRSYYYLWSLERIGVTLNLQTLAKKDWYNWGAEILLASQDQNGNWIGEYGKAGIDTCFALLFLRKANLARDLSGSLRGLKDPGARALKAGGVGGGALKGGGDKPLESDLGKKPEVAKKDDKGEKGKTETPKTGEKAKPRSAEEEAADRLTRDLVRSGGQTREGLLKSLRDSKGGAYTEALAAVIPKLDNETKKLAREALADRLTRMKADTLREYFKEKDAEVRCAAAIAAGQKEAKSLVPDLIELLGDKESLVQRGARASLRSLAGKDLGADAGPWREWWKKQVKE